MHDHNITIAGDGPHTLLFAHGYGCDQDMWRWVAPAFADRYRVVTFDHAGCGRRGRVPYNPRRYSSLDAYAEDMQALIQRHNLAPVTIVGHSVSAIIGVLVSIQAPQLVRALALIGPSPCYRNDGEYRGGFEAADIAGLLEALDANHQGWAASLAPKIMGNVERPELAEELSASFCRMDLEAARGFAEVTFTADNRRDLVKVTVPTLIMQCRDDVIAGDAVGAYVHAAIAGSTLVNLQATGHCPNLSAPDEVVAVLNAWLEHRNV